MQQCLPVPPCTFSLSHWLPACRVVSVYLPACPQKLCDGRGWKTVRIDGGTDVAKRQDVVNSFNLYGVGQVRERERVQEGMGGVRLPFCLASLCLACAERKASKGRQL